MIQRADSLVAVSETLQGMIAQEGRSASLLRHGVDVDFWTSSRMGFQTRHDENCADLDVSGSPSCLANGPTVVFWGVIDRRIDTASLVRLSQDFDNGRIVLIGPQQDPDPAILAVSNIKILPAQPLNALPAIAQQADVLIMPYADLPVTRAMQPLKLKEYLATGKPVVVNRLPSTEAWCDCLDVAESPQQFSRLVRERINRGIPASQVSARTRLQHESWKSKAEQLEQILKGDDR